MRWTSSMLAFAVLAACGDCGACSEASRVEGAHPYLRCTALELEDRGWEVGGLSFGLEGRSLEVGGLDPAEVLAFAVDPGATFDELPEAPLRVVLGGFARDAESAERILAGLAAQGPTLLLPGGGDDTEVLTEALDAVGDPGLVDLRGVELLRLGGHEWVVIPGAPGGRYARGDAACGFAASDLEAYDLGDAEGPRHLLAWAAPAGLPIARGYDRVPVGSEAAAILAERTGAAGGLYAWPRAHPGEATDSDSVSGWSLVVPVWGRINIAADGSWGPGGTARVELGSEDLRRVDR